MYSFDKTALAIQATKNLLPDDKELLSSYHQWKNGPPGMSPGHIARLESTLNKSLHDKKFNARLASFEIEIRKNEIEFPYLDLLKIRQLLSAIDDSKVLTQNGKEFLSLYHKAMNMEKEMNDEEKEHVSKAMIEKLNDKEFVHTLSLFEKEIKKGNIAFPYLDTLLKYSHGLQEAAYSGRFIKNIQRIDYVTSKGGLLEEDEKLSMAELGMIEKLKDLNRCIGIFKNEKGFLLNSEQSKKIENQCAKIESLSEKLNSLYEPDLYQSGDVLVTDTDKNRAYKLEHTRSDFFEKGNLFNLAKRLFTRYGHVAQLTQVDDALKQSHLWGKHQIDPFGFENITSSDIFRLNISKLVGADEKEILSKQLGVNWKEELQALYANKIALISKNNALKKAKIISGLASIEVLLPHWVGKNKNEYLGLFSKSNTEETLLHREQMICSDFVAREINEAINLVNLDLKERNLTNPIKSPFPSYVNLSRVHPQGLIELLKKAGCLDKIKPTKLHTLVNTRKNYKSLLDHQVESTTDLYDKVFKLAQKYRSEEAFITRATLEFKGYLHSNELLSKEKLNEIDAFLVQPLKELYQQDNSTSTSNFARLFFELLKSFIHFVGLKDKKNIAIIDATVKKITAQSAETKMEEKEPENNQHHPGPI